MDEDWWIKKLSDGTYIQVEFLSQEEVEEKRIKKREAKKKLPKKKRHLYTTRYHMVTMEYIYELQELRFSFLFSHRNVDGFIIP